jgi:hypothetical protein
VRRLTREGASAAGAQHELLPWHAPITKAFRAGLFLACHTFVALALISSVYVVHGWLETLGNPKMFGVIPVGFVFDAVDLTVLVFFMWYGVKEARKVFRE